MALVDRPTIFQVVGSLMKHPQYLSETDKYNLTPEDFPERLDKFIFVAIDSLYRNGAEHIKPIDVENYLQTNEGAANLFKKENGIGLLQDMEYLSEELNFPYYYKKLKKFNLLDGFKKQGINIEDFYCENPLTSEALATNQKFEELEIEDIVDGVKRKVLTIERNFVQNDTTETRNVLDGIKDVLAAAGTSVNIGIPLQGEIFNEACAGARKGKFYLRSAGSGVGKTRSAVSDACYMAFPIRYEESEGKWVASGSNEKVMIITTEQTQEEIQTMVLAYLTGFNETKFRYGGFTKEEEHIIAQTLWVLEQFQDNLFIVRMPNPTIELVKTIAREGVMIHDIGCLFYDYIHISPSLLGEFKGFNLRNDEVLLMFSTALKDLAVELDIFVMSSTQLNANGDNNQNIKNESAISGSRSIINKADIGCILSRPTKEELDFLHTEGGVSFEPTIVCDLYKVRAGQYNQIRIWSDFNHGNLRKVDLFATNARMEVIPIINEYRYENWDTDDETIKEVLKIVNEME